MRRHDLVIVATGALLTLAALAGGPALIGLLGLAVLVLLILVYPVVGLASILISGPTYLLLTPYIPKGLPFSFLLLLLTVTGLALRRVHERRAAPFRWTWVDAAAAFLLVNGLVYIPMATNFKTGIYGYHEILRLFLLYFVVRLLAPGPAATRILLWSVALTGFAVTAYGCIQTFWGYEYIMVKYDLVESLRDYAGFDSGRVARAYSILVSPLSLGYVGMIGVLSSVAILVVPSRDDQAARLAPLLLAVSAGASAFSFTRSSWLGIAAALAAAFLTVVRGRDRLLLIASPLVLVALALRFVPSLAETIGSYALTIVSRDPAKTSMHYVALVAAAQYFWDHKLGVGLGSASFAGFQHGTGVQFWSENTFFQMGIQTGFQGMLALIAFLFAAVMAGWRLSRDPGVGRMPRRVGAAVFLGLIGFSVAGISIPTLLDAAAFGPVWFMAAVVVNQSDSLPGSADDQFG
ncbi:MAG: O-antigen ligase family protein [Candidatus Eisenbacteria bacterium]|nr:O-antigen ligase family protein [Candidatus Eisenbacteria bacterium]